MKIFDILAKSFSTYLNASTVSNALRILKVNAIGKVLLSFKVCIRDNSVFSQLFLNFQFQQWCVETVKTPKGQIVQDAQLATDDLPRCHGLPWSCESCAMCCMWWKKLKTVQLDLPTCLSFVVKFLEHMVLASEKATLQGIERWQASSSLHDMTEITEMICMFLDSSKKCTR